MALFDKTQVLTRLEIQRAKYIDEFKAAKLQFEKDFKFWKQTAGAAFRQYVAAAEPGKDKYGDMDKFRPPSPPSLSGNAASLARLIREIEMMTPNSKGAVNLGVSTEVSRWL